MQRRSFVKSSLLAATALTTSVAQAAETKSEAVKNELYELRTYELKFGSPQSNLDKYFKDALIPVFNKYGVKNVGVFTEISKSEPAKVYLLIPYPSIEEFASISAKVKADADFKKAAENYTALPVEKAPYARFTTSLLIAFDGLKQMLPTRKDARIFEIRTYEGYNEEALRRKVKMFNEGELDIFYQTKLNPVFFGEVISGDKMPCLTYMLTFKDMAERDANWKNFGAAPAWKTISALPEYANSVSKITKIFLEPTSYSQV